jgi:hypothetical protein
MLRRLKKVENRSRTIWVASPEEQLRKSTIHRWRQWNQLGQKDEAAHRKARNDVSSVLLLPSRSVCRLRLWDQRVSQLKTSPSATASSRLRRLSLLLLGWIPRNSWWFAVTTGDGRSSEDLHFYALPGIELSIKRTNVQGWKAFTHWTSLCVDARHGT